MKDTRMQNLVWGKCWFDSSQLSVSLPPGPFLCLIEKPRSSHPLGGTTPVVLLPLTPHTPSPSLAFATHSISFLHTPRESILSHNSPIYGPLPGYMGQFPQLISPFFFFFFLALLFQSSRMVLALLKTIIGASRQWENFSFHKDFYHLFEAIYVI